MSALYPTKANSEGPGLIPYPTTTNLKWDSLTRPMTLDKFPKFKAMSGISINVFMLEPLKTTFKVLSSYVTKKKMDRHVNCPWYRIRTKRLVIPASIMYGLQV